MDWNGDGKRDEKDDAFYNNIIEPNNKQNNNSKPPSAPTGNGCSSPIWNLIALGYLAILLPGHIDINVFTFFLGLICAGKLLLSFIAWLYG